MPQTLDGTMQSAIVADIACLVEVEIGMSAKLTHRELVDLQFRYLVFLYLHE